jgi:hypothetical protein
MARVTRDLALAETRLCLDTAAPVVGAVKRVSMLSNPRGVGTSRHVLPQVIGAHGTTPTVQTVEGFGRFLDSDRLSGQVYV